MSEERIDETGFGNIKVIQRSGFGYGVDSVLLAAFAAGETGAKRIADGSHVADLGTGSGIVAFVLHHKLKDAKLTGFDVRQEAVATAVRANEINGLQDDVEFICADVLDLAVPGTGQPHSYDAVVTNPPYFRKTPGEPGAAEPNERYIARHETTADAQDFASAAARLLKSGGSLFMVHRPDRLADVICGMRAAGIEPKELQLVVPAAGRAANIMLIHGIKGAGPELRVLPDIAVHDAAGGYTDEILRYYER